MTETDQDMNEQERFNMDEVKERVEPLEKVTKAYSLVQGEMSLKRGRVSNVK